MVEQVQRYRAQDGREFATEEAALMHEAVERMVEALPELRMIETRLRANLPAFADSLGRLASFRAKNHPEAPGKTTLKPSQRDRWTACSGTAPAPVAVDHGELAGTCDCSAGMNGDRHHHRTCPSYRPVLPRAVAHA